MLLWDQYVLLRDADNKPIQLFKYEDLLETSLNFPLALGWVDIDLIYIFLDVPLCGSQSRLILFV